MTFNKFAWIVSESSTQNREEHSGRKPFRGTAGIPGIAY